MRDAVTDRVATSALPAASACALLAQARNVHKMELVEGRGNEFVDGRAAEGDAINRVYVLDSNALPFNQAEVRCAPPAHMSCLCTPAGPGGAGKVLPAHLSCLCTSAGQRAGHPLHTSAFVQSMMLVCRC